MAISMSGIQTLLEAAATAVASSDYPTARSKLIQAEIQYEGLPADAGTGSQRARFERRTKQLLDAVDRMEATAARATDNKRFAVARTRHAR